MSGSPCLAPWQSNNKREPQHQTKHLQTPSLDPSIRYPTPPRIFHLPIELLQWSQSAKSRPAAPGKTGPPLTPTSKALVCDPTAPLKRCLPALWARKVLGKYELSFLFSPSPPFPFPLPLPCSRADELNPPPRHAVSWSTLSKRKRCRGEPCYWPEGLEPERLPSPSQSARSWARRFHSAQSSGARSTLRR